MTLYLAHWAFMALRRANQLVTPGCESRTEQVSARSAESPTLALDIHTLLTIHAENEWWAPNVGEDFTNADGNDPDSFAYVRKRRS